MFDIEYKCVQCGHCCETGSCFYGEWDSEKERCKFLSLPDKYGRKNCLKHEEITEKEKNALFPMMGCGCSSTLFNTKREMVIKNFDEDN